jgi:WD40 repeat protein
MLINRKILPSIRFLGLFGLLIGFIAGCETPSLEVSETQHPAATKTPFPTDISTATITSMPSISPTITPTSTENDIGPQIIHKWDAGAVNQSSSRQNFIADIAWSPNNIDVAVATFGENAGSIDLFNSRTSERSWSVETGLTFSLDFSPDGEVLAANFPTPGVIRLWDVATGDIQLEIEGEECLVGRFLGFNPDGKAMMTGYDFGKETYETIINLWDLESDQCEGEFIRRDGLLESLTVHRKGDQLILTLLKIQEGESQQVILWDLATGEQVCSIAGSMHAVSQNGDVMAVLGQDQRQIGIWKMASCDLVGTFHTDIGVISFDISPDGNLLAVGGDRFQLWDLSTGDKLHELQGSPNLIKRLAFSPDGRFIITAGPAEPSERSAVILWGLEP